MRLLPLPWPVAAVWLCFLARLGFYSTMLPLWEGYDEWAHFSVIRTMALQGRILAPRDQPIPRDVERSLQLAPVPWELRDLPAPALTQEAYWSLPDDARRQREREFRAIPEGWSREPAIGPLTAYEALQPPLYYWMMAPIVRLAGRGGLAEQVMLVRWFSVLIASLTIPVVFLIGRIVFRDIRTALCCAVAAAVMPEFAIDVARVGNECLGVLLFTILIWIGARLAADARRHIAGPLADARGSDRSRDREGAVFPGYETVFAKRRTELALGLGVALGLGLLTKAYFLTAVPAVILLLAYAYRGKVYRGKVYRGKVYRGKIAAGSVPLIVAALISGWWYVRNLRVTGTLSGLSESVVLRDMSPVAIVARGAHLNWKTAIDAILFSHIYFGGWSSLMVRAWMYHVFYLMIAAAGLGLWRAFRRPAMWWLIVIYSMFWLGQLYNVLLLFVSKGLPGSMGWYLYAVIGAEALICVAGLSGIHRWAAPGGVLLLVLLDLYSVHAVAIPYYTGMIGHKANGPIAALHLAGLKAVGVRGAFERLTVFKGPVVSEPLLMALWAAYLAATVWLLTAVLLPSIANSPDSAGSKELPVSVR